MLNYDNTAVNKRHAVKFHEKKKLGHLSFDEDAIDFRSSERVLKIKEVENIYEAKGAIFTVSIFYNGKLFKDEVHQFWDYYGFFKAADGVREAIEKMTCDYDLNGDAKFDIRVSYAEDRQMFALRNGRLKALDNYWYYDSDDSSEYFRIMDEQGVFGEDERIKGLDKSKACRQTSPVEIYSSLKDGLEFKESFYERFKKEILEEGFKYEL